VLHAWQAAWIALGAVALLATWTMRAPTRPLACRRRQRRHRADFAGRRSHQASPGTSLFGVGYIGYMTFVITLLREQRNGMRPRSPASTSCSVSA
jgi:hypothetical protein